MPEPVPPTLATSKSFSGVDSPTITTNMANRRISSSTSTLEFFAPAAKSFQPLPYTPHALFGTAENRAKSFTARNPQRAQDTLAHPGMEPLATDPNVVFIRPPFTSFPNAHLYTDGLSYQTLANNPEWFLDAKDFTHENNTNPDAIPYPTILEPPRGWCPARKKDLKERGESWPEGEEPRLRCTFCRRTYAGVNAKSMWRRHVFEKHKIAMANRRDGNERPRGRSSGKENKQLPNSKPREQPHDKVLSMEVAPQPNTDIIPHKSKFRSALPREESKPQSRRDHDKDDVFTRPKTPVLSHPEASGSGSSSVKLELEDTFNENDARLSPLLQPHPDEDLPPEITKSSLLITEPPSPYDQSVTPAFRHSPPRLPSDQPWRFPSPSHPLHFQTRDVPLTMLAPSPLFKVSLTSGASPQSSPLSTPNVSRSSDLKTPSTLGFSMRSGSRPWFLKNHFGSPLEKHSKAKGRFGSSPLSSSLRGTPASHKRNISALSSDDWFGDSVLQSDPFAALCSPWNRPSRDSSPRKGIRSLGDVSPVLRTAMPIDLGLGIGLLAPFSLPKEPPTPEDIDAELEAMERAEIGRAAGPSVPRKQPLSDSPSHCSPPSKRRRLSSP